MPTITQFPSPFQERIRNPRFRGKLTKIDSAETQLGLLEAGNGEGKVYLLVEPKTGVVEKARFLSFGRLESLVALDVFCEQGIGKNVLELQGLGFQEMASKCEGLTESDFEFLPQIIKGLGESLPTMKVEEPLEEKPGAYKRKEKNEMNEVDLAWLPLGAPQKIAKLQTVIDKVLLERTEYRPNQVELYNVQRDLLVQIKFSGDVQKAHRPLILGFLTSQMKADLHPELVVEEVA